MEFITDDNYIIKEGSKIYYTGDMANIEGNFIVTKIEPCEWYKFKVTVKEKEAEGNRVFRLTPTSFDNGIGRRFKPVELVMKERVEAKKRLQNMIIKSRQRS